MKQLKTTRCLLMLALALCVSGFATGNVNLSQAGANMGHMGFSAELSGTVYAR